MLTIAESSTSVRHAYRLVFLHGKYLIQCALLKDREGRTSAFGAGDEYKLAVRIKEYSSALGNTKSLTCKCVKREWKKEAEEPEAQRQTMKIAR